MSGKQERKGTMYAFATIGARAERGGYVTHATSGLVICGLAIIANPAYGHFAYVGGVRDSGDTITDSPERQGGARPGTYRPVTGAQVKQEGKPA